MTPRGRSTPFRPWRYRYLLRQLVVRDLRVKYQNSLLGFIWTLLNPLLTAGVLVAVFSAVVRIPIPAYWAFLLSGYFVWNTVQFTLSSGTFVLHQHNMILRGIAFPSEILLVASATSKLVEFGIEMILVIGALVLFHHGGVPLSLLFLPMLVALQVILTLGLMYPIAALSVLFRDVEHAVPIVLTLLFYLSPVFYPVSMVPEWAMPWYYLNPFAILLELFHAVLYQGVFPDPVSVLMVLGVSGVILAAGRAFFLRYEHLLVEQA